MKEKLNIMREIASINGVNYYLGMLEEYTDNEYKLAYKYYEHIQVDTKHFKDFAEITKARTTYMNIMNCLFGIFDIFHMELQDSDIKDFVFYRNLKCTFEAGLRYKREYTINYKVYYTNIISIKEFNRDEVLKFVNNLIDMCLEVVENNLLVKKLY